MPSDGQAALSTAGGAVSRGHLLCGVKTFGAGGRWKLSGATHSSLNTQERLLFLLFRIAQMVPRISTAAARKNSHNFIPKVPALAKVLKSAPQREHCSEGLNILGFHVWWKVGSVFFWLVGVLPFFV